MLYDLLVLQEAKKAKKKKKSNWVLQVLTYPQLTAILGFSVDTAEKPRSYEPVTFSSSSRAQSSVTRPSWRTASAESGHRSPTSCSSTLAALSYPTA